MEQYTFTPEVYAAVELDAAAIKGLSGQRVELVASPGPRRCLMVRDIIIRKTGEDGVDPALNIQRLALALVPATGGRLVNGTTGDTLNNHGVTVAKLSLLIPAGPAGVHLETGMIFATDGLHYAIVPDRPLSVCAVANSDSQWQQAVGDLQDTKLVVAVRYEIMQIDG